MKPIPLSLPAGAQVVGEILRSYRNATHRLSEDILQVTLPTGVVIDVGWTPRFDPVGSFRITVFRGEWENQVVPSIRESNPYEVVKLVHELAFEHGQLARVI